MNFRALAEQVKRRRGYLGLKQDEVVKLAGADLSVAVLSQIENARNARPRPSTLRALERGLVWPELTADDVLEGAEPTTWSDLREQWIGEIERAAADNVSDEQREDLGAQLAWVENQMRLERRLRQKSFGLAGTADGDRLGVIEAKLDDVLSRLGELATRSWIDQRTARVVEAIEALARLQSTGQAPRVERP